MRAAPILVCFILFSCSPPPPPGVEPEPGEPLTDAGQVDVDAGPDLDAGADLDAGTEVDAGTNLDAGLPDAGQLCSCTLPSYCSNGSCVVDARAPQLTVTAAAGVTSGKLRVSGTAVDAETGITSVSVRVNQAAALTLPVTMGVFATELDTTDPEFTIIVTGRDAAGNEGSAQATFDPTAPRITLTPADAACTSSGCTGAIISSTTAPLTITATVTDAALAATSPVTIRVVSATGTQLVAATDMVRSGATWTWTWTNPPALDDTAIDFIVTATDAAQNAGSATVHGRIDRVAPQLAVTSTQDASCDQNGCTGAVITASTTDFTLSGTSDAAQVSLRVRDGAAVIVTAPSLPVATGAWTWTWAGPPQADGRYFSAEFTATDTLGNATTVARVVLVDRVLPSLVVASPSAGTLVGASTVSVISNAADGLGVKVVEVSSQGAPIAATLDMSGDYVANVSVPVVDAVEQTLTIRAVDLVGNARSLTRRYVADRVAPVVTIQGIDFDCSGAQCTGMVVNRAASSVAFSGTATDGSAVNLQKTVFGTAQVAASTDPVNGGAWSWSWSSLPANVNGAPYELRVVATDAAGNVSQQSVRRVWLDNVAPTVTVVPAGQRNVGPTAPLLRFSEPMVVSSVLSGAGFMPFASGLETNDRRTFAFSSNVLSPYTPYRLVASSGIDLAGNELAAPGDGTFLTAPVTRGAVTTVRQPAAGFTYRHPVVAIDSDQQMYVSFTSIGSSSSLVETSVLDGTGSERRPPRSWLDTTCREGEIRMVSESRGADQRLSTILEHAVVCNLTSNWSAAHGTQTTTWNGQTLETTLFLESFSSGTPTSGSTINDVFRPTIELTPYSSGPRRTLVSPNIAGTSIVTAVQQSLSAWDVSNTASLTNFRRMDSRASIETSGSLGQNRVRYYDLGAMSEVGTYGFVRAATGQPMNKRLDTFFGVPASNSGAFVAWMNDTQLTIACSPAPFAAAPVWRPTAVSMPQTQTSGITSTKDATRVIVAAEFGGSVHVYSTPLNGCAAAPKLDLLGALSGLKDPNLFIDGAGTVWVAGIATNGAVVVHKL